MKNCPLCAVSLEPETYEGFRIFRCPQCQGHLVELSRYESIQRIPEKSLAELEAEAQAGFQGDHPEPIRCPRCHLKMVKQPIPIPGHSLYMDVCSACALAWFDGGELAMAQLGYQTSDAFRNAQDAKQRAADLEADPARKAAFEKAVKKLPRSVDPYTEGFREAIFNALLSHPTSSYFGTRL